VREDLGLEAFREHHIRNIWAMLRASQELSDQYLQGILDKNTALQEEAPNSKPDLAPDQRIIVDEIMESVREGWRLEAEEEYRWKGESGEEGPWQQEWSEDVEDMEPPAEPAPAAVDPFAAQLPAHAKRQAFAVLGPAGSGKTAAIEEAVEQVSAQGGRVLIAAPTGKLAATFRQKYPQLDVDTVHGAFAIWKPLEQTVELMMPFDLIIVEEVGQLSRWTFERLMQLWMHAEGRPTLVFVGDFWQLQGVEPTKVFDSPLWHTKVRRRRLHTMRRCKCEILADKLRLLRTGKPDRAGLKFIKRGRKAPSTYGTRHSERMQPPTAGDVKQVLAETPHTTFLTITRKAVAQLNQWAVEALFAEAPVLVELPVENDLEDEGAPVWMPVYSNMRITLTKNLNKSIGFVNGMGCTVLRMGQAGLYVRTDQGRIIMVHPWTDENRVTTFPFRLGYATTLHKVQGATLDHITLWLDLANMPASGYVAISRVRKDIHWRFLGDPTRHHFTPARFD